MAVVLRLRVRLSLLGAVLLLCGAPRGGAAGFVAMDGFWLHDAGNSTAAAAAVALPLPRTATAALADGWTVASLGSCTASKGRLATKLSAFAALELYYADLSSPNDYLVGIGVLGSVGSFAAFVDPGTICALSFQPTWYGVFSAGNNFLMEAVSNPVAWVAVTDETLFGTPCGTTETAEQALADFWPRAVKRGSSSVVGVTFGSATVLPHLQFYFTATRAPCLASPPPPPPPPEDSSSASSRDTRLITLGILAGIFGVGLVAMLIIRRFIGLGKGVDLNPLRALQQQRLGVYAQTYEKRPHILKSLTEQHNAYARKLKKHGGKFSDAALCQSHSSSDEGDSSDDERSSSSSPSTPADSDHTRSSHS